MYSIHNRDDLEKLKQMQETKSLLHKKRSKGKLGKQDFHYNMEEVFEPVTENQKQNVSNNKNFPKSKYKHYEIRLKIQHKTKLEQYENRVIQCKNQLKKEYKNMMKLLTVIISYLRILLIPTKLILVL